MENAVSKTDALTCPFCEVSGLAEFGRNSTRCATCGGVLGGEFLAMLRRIVALPGPEGRHACECGHPEMRLLPDEVYRCPACGSEVVPVSAGAATWKSPDRSDAFWAGWLDGRYGGREPFGTNRRLERWSEAPERLDYYRGHRAGREARANKTRLIEAS